MGFLVTQRAQEALLEARIWDTFGRMLDHLEWSAFIATVVVCRFGASGGTKAREVDAHRVRAEAIRRLVELGLKKGAATMIRVLSVALLLTVLAPGNRPALSQPLTTLYSGDELLPACRSAIGAEQPGAADLVKATYCVGVVAALIAIGPMLQPDYRFCFPKGGNTEQAVQVVVAVLELKPSALQLDFRLLAVTAMKDSWPCKP